MENLLIKQLVGGTLKEVPANKEVLKYELDYLKKDRKIALKMGKLHLISSQDGRGQLRDQLSKKSEKTEQKIKSILKN